MNNNIYKDNIEKIVNYLNELKWSIDLNISSEQSQCIPEERRIIINEPTDIDILYTLLHEAGHGILFDDLNYSNSFNELVIQDELPEEEKSNLYHYQKLKEEMLAWENGLTIAISLELNIDEDDYDKTMAKSFMSYVYNSSKPYYQNELKKIMDDNGLEIKFEN